MKKRVVEKAAEQHLDVTVRMPEQKFGHFMKHVVIGSTYNILIKVAPAGDKVEEELM